MPYLPDTMPPPEPSDASQAFWDHCAERRLAFQACGDCGQLVHPPLPVCPRCQSLNRAWRAAPSRGAVYSCTWIHTAAHEAVAGALPYNVALIEFPALPDVRLVSNVVDVRPGELHIGDTVYLHWERFGVALWLPRFRKHPEDAL